MPTVYVTAPPGAGAEIARTVVEEELAACVNTVECSSVYRWEGDVHEDDELILLVKTTDDRYPALKARLRELHPYDVPCIERFEESDVLGAFAEWRAENT
ncbi:divalent cation tolerance protein CutA [Halovenus sp. WSH3]|uniref:Divalent cation tolerance protein CutA n=1 Tax=Halovenus carboxidivorans TaxID=2692199 RepID=A0A6B0T252_9EURY|nr:divalent-cation tolerance protein CutA [Halovenus carboxidivorans]MXR52144.1 divalent cation tolerance protein CutA [Halovenus carboxidivorans]